MTTREEIEAAAARYEAGAYVKQKDGIGAWDEYWRPIQKDNDLHTLANAYLAERAERERKIEAAVQAIGARFMTKESEAAEIREIITRCLAGEAT